MDKYGLRVNFTTTFSNMAFLPPRTSPLLPIPLLISELLLLLLLLLLLFLLLLLLVLFHSPPSPLFLLIYFGRRQSQLVAILRSGQHPLCRQ